MGLKDPYSNCGRCQESSPRHSRTDERKAVTLTSGGGRATGTGRHCVEAARCRPVRRARGERSCRVADMRRTTSLARSRDNGIGLLDKGRRRNRVSLRAIDGMFTGIRRSRCERERERSFGSSRGGVRLWSSTPIRVSHVSHGDAAGNTVTRAPSRDVMDAYSREDPTTSLTLRSRSFVQS